MHDERKGHRQEKDDNGLDTIEVKIKLNGKKGSRQAKSEQAEETRQTLGRKFVETEEPSPNQADADAADCYHVSAFWKIRQVEDSIERFGEQEELTINDLRFTIGCMYVGRVRGTVVATVKHEAFNGRKLLIVDHLNIDGQPTGNYDICVDTVQAGVGDRVLVLDEGNGARQILKREVAPVRAMVVGIVDEVSIIRES